jgi:type II secretory ATPase GspE/PulE/Tfp pilus assembly ATPase PilB-like protein
MQQVAALARTRRNVYAGPVLLDLTATAAEWWLKFAAIVVAVVILTALVVFLTPLWRYLKRKLTGKGEELDVVSLDGMLEEDGRPLSALSTVHRAASEMAALDPVPTTRLLDYIIAQAWNMGASDVHFSPSSSGMNVELRIDGLLYPICELTREGMESMLIRLKILARLNVYKRDVPQDGRINV